MLVAAATLVAYATVATARTRPTERFGIRTIARRYRSVLREPGAFRIYPLVFLGGATVFGIFPLVGTVLAGRLGTGPFEAGMVLAGFGVGGVLFGIAIRLLLARLGMTRLAFLGAVAAGASMAAFALPLPWQACAALFVVLGFAYYMTHSTLQVQVSELSRDASGSAMSIFALSMFSAQGIGPILYGLALARFPAETVIAVAGLAIAAIGCLSAANTVGRAAERV